MILPALLTLPTCNLDRCLYDDVSRRHNLFFSRLSQSNRSAASKSYGGKIAGKIAKARLGSTLTTGIIFSGLLARLISMAFGMLDQ
jgi:hypothetical protein